MSMPFFGQDTATEPLIDPWWTPGWTSQHPDYQVAPVNPFTEQGFPNQVIYINVSGNYFDNDGNPIGGYLTFWPSTQLTLSVGGLTTTVFQRRVGYNFWDYNQSGSGKMYLHNGQLLVSLLATDNVAAGMSPANFSYHVKEHTFKGREYDIIIPSTSSNPVDINSLIVPGSTEAEEQPVQFTMALASTIYIPANISTTIGGVSFNPTADAVSFAFIAGPTEPQSGDWNTGVWVSGGPPYIAQILVGPSGGLSLSRGSYIIWCKVTASSQVPVFQVGQLTIY